ncbi:hypothetical protein EZZ76_06500 [Neisseria meningitidis]|nr:hypothetical protein [Neisseria meningitidis]
MRLFLMKRKPYSNCLLLLFQDFFQRFGINQMYSGLTKIRTIMPVTENGKKAILLLKRLLKIKTTTT